jgi:hypothetical protein
VTDPGHQVIFIAESNEYRDPYASFSFVISDNESDSSPAKVNLLSIAPFPHLTIRWGQFSDLQVLFGKGQPNTYHIWGSSDLVTWRDLGEPSLWEPGVLGYFEYSTTQPAGFYKVIAR